MQSEPAGFGRRSLTSSSYYQEEGKLLSLKLGEIFITDCNGDPNSVPNTCLDGREVIAM